MTRARPARLATTLVAAVALALSATAAGALAAPPPIPQNAADLAGLKLFTGHKAKPHPIKAPKIPRHPFMAANGRNAVHNDAYQSDTYRNSGPLGQNLRVFSQSVDGNGGIGSCGITIAFDKRGRLVTTCISATTITLRLMRPDLTTVANFEVGPRIIPPGVNPFQSPGGAYFYVDNKDRAFVSVGREVQVIAIRGNTLTRVKTYDLSSAIPADDQLNSALPDWRGRLWFVTREHGIVGDVDPATGRVLGTHRTGEAIGNSFAMDETGGVFIVTDKAQYRFDATRAGKPKVTWRVKYKNIGRKKPGQFDAGSGTTPTLMGKQYLSIADNAARMNVVVLRRAKHLKRGQRRVVCQQPVFRRGAGDTENSIIATPTSMIVENNYGYFPPPDATSNGKTTTPGVARVDIKRGGHGCRTVWTSKEISPSTVPKMSLANGLIYLYTKPAGLPDAWYLTAVDFRTGKTVWRRLIGTGLLFNVHYAGLTISPKGVLYSGVLGGTIGVADR
jgi:hypothetical protein